MDELSKIQLLYFNASLSHDFTQVFPSFKKNGDSLGQSFSGEIHVYEWVSLSG